MDYALITLTSLVVSGPTLFSGFGLGTLLMHLDQDLMVPGRRLGEVFEREHAR